jgi:hypothetical protein
VVKLQLTNHLDNIFHQSFSSYKPLSTIKMKGGKLLHKASKIVPVPSFHLPQAITYHISLEDVF